MSASKKQGKIYIELVGGLGNQLFQAVATISLAQKLSYQPIAIVNRLSESHSHRNSIFDEMSWSSLKKKRLNSIAMIFVIFGFRLASRSKTSNFSFFGINFYSPSETGYSLAEVKGRFVFLRGYFQSHRYLHGIDIDALPYLASPSEAFHALESQLKIEKPIVLHIRKGDFAKDKNPHGIIPVHYYQASLEALREKKQAFDSLWIFTDEPKGINSYLKELPVSKLISHEFNLTTTEELFLMSKANCLIIGNSTFGCWGGLLAEAFSQGEHLVIRPTNPYQGIRAPQDFYPEHWISVSIARSPMHQ